MINIARLLGANKTFATKEMTDVLNFEIELANVSAYYNKNNLTHYCFQLKINLLKNTLSTLIMFLILTESFT
jgi:hypothetical protein